MSLAEQVELQYDAKRTGGSRVFERQGLAFGALARRDWKGTPAARSVGWKGREATMLAVPHSRRAEYPFAPHFGNAFINGRNDLPRPAWATLPGGLGAFCEPSPAAGARRQSGAGGPSPN